MKVEITTEMLRKAVNAHKERGLVFDAIEVVAPIIADQVLERAAKALDGARDYRAAEETRALKEPTP